MSGQVRDPAQILAALGLEDGISGLSQRDPGAAATGEELDTFSANDELDHYQREFRGSVEEMIGRYAPGEDVPEDTPEDDPESMSNWRICYYIERA